MIIGYHQQFESTRAGMLVEYFLRLLPENGTFLRGPFTHRLATVATGKLVLTAGFGVQSLFGVKSRNRR
ncbi:MAG: hypothetical protein KF752_18230 [Pirellulaceae bacterium]|nr:hypothetical protein [Pirellulaceae bacterium]